MTEDYVVSCWPIPVKKRGQKESDYKELLEKIAVGCGGKLDWDEYTYFIEIEKIIALPGDILCETRRGRLGVRRANRKG